MIYFTIAGLILLIVILIQQGTISNHQRTLNAHHQHLLTHSETFRLLDAEASHNRSIHETIHNRLETLTSIDKGLHDAITKLTEASESHQRSLEILEQLIPCRPDNSH